MHKIVSGEKRQLGEVGRSSVLYRIREEHESYLAIHFWIEYGNRRVECIVFSTLGRILYQKEKEYDSLPYGQVEKAIEEIREQYPNINQIHCRYAKHSGRRSCEYSDIPELEDVMLQANLEKGLGWRSRWK